VHSLHPGPSPRAIRITKSSATATSPPPLFPAPFTLPLARVGSISINHLVSLVLHHKQHCNVLVQQCNCGSPPSFIPKPLLTMLLGRQRPTRLRSSARPTPPQPHRSAHCGRTPLAHVSAHLSLSAHHRTHSGEVPAAGLPAVTFTGHAPGPNKRPQATPPSPQPSTHATRRVADKSVERGDCVAHIKRGGSQAATHSAYSDAHSRGSAAVVSGDVMQPAAGSSSHTPIPLNAQARIGVPFSGTRGSQLTHEHNFTRNTHRLCARMFAWDARVRRCALRDREPSPQPSNSRVTVE
jgi:hypothetical protein